MSIIKIGTRPSPLALKQAELVSEQLRYFFPDFKFSIVPISSDGDLNPHQPLSELGGKGVFIRTLEKALLSGECDLVAHSFKDITAESLAGLTLAGYLKPDVISDCLVTPLDAAYKTLSALPERALIGTSSLRRKALLHRLRPDLRFKDIRGNVETRIRLCDEGQYDAIILSEAGLVRLALHHRISESLDPTIFLPAPGQGIIALQCRAEDPNAHALCSAITSPQQGFLSQCEWAFMKSIGLGCNVPLGLHTVLLDTTLKVQVYLQSTSGEDLLETHHFNPEQAASDLIALGKRLKAHAHPA